MGRSVPTYRMKLEELIAGLGDYRRALREEDRRAFDALMNRARRYASAAGFQASSDPMETAMLSMLVGLEKDLEELVGSAARGAAGDRRAGEQEECGEDRAGEQDERPPAKAGGLLPREIAKQFGESSTEGRTKIGDASLPPQTGEARLGRGRAKLVSARKTSAEVFQREKDRRSFGPPKGGGLLSDEGGEGSG